MDGIESNGVRMLTIEWEMMDKSRFFGLSAINSLGLRVVLYPLTVIKTRLQVQRHGVVYKGTFDAFRNIIKNEGFSGLYKGFWINSVQVVSGIGYILTYEKIRDILSKNNIHDNRLKGLIAGGCGSLVSQTIICPFDVISQHLMLLGSGHKSQMSSNVSKLNLDLKGYKGFGAAKQVIKELYRIDGGLKAYYRGYLSSVLTYVPSSALWWMFYPMYSGYLFSLSPEDTSQMLIQCVSGSISGITVAVITNPLDVLRANIQVRRIGSFIFAVKQIWAEEQFNIFRKGLSARITQSCISSAFIVAGYETLKRLSINEEHRHSIKW
ncbi:solute carrier family 25 member 44-like [Oppia nitens]|uniref:solute carrier family 25 member 44-like n=1 Tax=Oppia nitens TaxID=1686743 RepID=UPI0023DB0036|nr:solute carrier family 25 member 44-like [Oppia nitens]